MARSKAKGKKGSSPSDPTNNGSESKPKGRPRGNVKWKDIIPVQVYRLCVLGLTDVDVCHELGISRKTFWLWQQEHPVLLEAVKLARKERDCSQSLPKWIYARLSKELQRVWDNISAWEKEPNGAVKIELMLADSGVRVRQQLFLHALCVEQFSSTAACRKVNISKQDLDEWIMTDDRFAELVGEIQWHKANYFEQRLVQLVEEGNPTAVLFANRTLNASRGYGVRSRVDVNVSGEVTHGVVDLDEIASRLSPGARQELLDAIRTKEDVRPRRLTHAEVLNREIAEVLAEEDESQ